MSDSLTISRAEKRLFGNPSSEAIRTTQQTITINPGDRLYVHNLSGSATLFVSLGGTASATNFTFALAPGSANDDGKGTDLAIDDWSGGTVTVFSSSYRYKMFKQNRAG